MQQLTSVLSNGRSDQTPIEEQLRPRRDRLRTPGRAILPSNRALVGALLLAISGVATFAAWLSATETAGRPYVVAARPLAPGEVVRPEDVRAVVLDLPGEQRQQAFATVGAVVGRVVLGPIGPGELVQTAGLASAEASSEPVELSFELPRDRLVDGRLQPGEWVDVFGSDDRRTTQVVSHARVVAISDSGPSSFSSGADLVVTLGLDRPSDRVGLIDAVRHGEVTLTRSTADPGRSG